MLLVLVCCKMYLKHATSDFQWSLDSDLQRKFKKYDELYPISN